jgi:hypothetical protein
MRTVHRKMYRTSTPLKAHFFPWDSHFMNTVTVPSLFHSFSFNPTGRSTSSPGYSSAGDASKTSLPETWVWLQWSSYLSSPLRSPWNFTPAASLTGTGPRSYLHTILSVLRIRDPVPFFYSGSGIRNMFFPDLGSRIQTHKFDTLMTNFG